MEASSDKHIQYTLTAFIFGASCLRVFVCFQHNPVDYLWSDPLRHWMNGLRFPIGGYTAASDPILYQVYIAALLRITLGNRIMVGLASALLSVLMPWTYYRAARDFGMRKVAALWIWALIAWTPSLFTIYHYIMMETLLLAIDGAALWMTAQYLRKGGTQAFLVSVFVWTLACLTKPTVIPLAGICLVWSWLKKSPSLRDIAIAAVLAAILILPQAIRSRVALGFIAPFGNPWLSEIQHRSGAKTIYVHFHPHPSELFHIPSSANVHDMQFSSPSCYIEPLWPFSDWQIRRASGDSKIAITVDSAYGDREWRNAYNSLRVGWREWLAQWGENIVLFFFAPSWPETVVPEWDGWLTYVTRWMWAPLIIFVLVNNAREFLRRRFELVPVGVTLFTLFLALQNVATFEGRYRKPLEPLLLLNLVWVLRVEEHQTSGRTENRPLERVEHQGPTAGFSTLSLVSLKFSVLMGLLSRRCFAQACQVVCRELVFVSDLSSPPELVLVPTR